MFVMPKRNLCDKTMTLLGLYLGVVCSLLASCGGAQERKDYTDVPWCVVSDTIGFNDEIDLDELLTNGEMIMVTLYGEDTYYDYKGRAAGCHYRLCQRFADMLGVRLRIDVCRDTADMISKLILGDADVLVFPLPKQGCENGKIRFCGTYDEKRSVQWAVRKNQQKLADALDGWFKPDMLQQVKEEERQMWSGYGIRRRAAAPIMDKERGVISRYDAFFVAACSEIRWDWRLMAAQCYQESAFDPDAKSWAGACGLMQIMPTTAEHLKLPQERLFDPESNIFAAARFLAELDGMFSDVSSRKERICFVLASYNGGALHIRDAMALAERDGKDCHVWEEVSRYLKMLSEPAYYNDSIVKNGYIRGSETLNYVESIMSRWQSYRNVRVGLPSVTYQQKHPRVR